MANETVALCPQTWTDLARSVAWQHGIDLGVDEADYILWNHTGFPSFWNGDPRTCCEVQLHNYFERID